MPTAEPDDAVVTLLDAISSPVALNSNENLFLGPPLDPDAARPAKAVFVELMREKSRRFTGTTSDWRECWVKVSIRADRTDYTGSQALIRAVRDALLAPTVSGYTACQVDDGPYFSRLDSAGRSVWELTAYLCRAT